MRVAIETILWGQHPESLEKMLQDAKEAGYDGVELWQHPVFLSPAARLYGLLRDLDLCMVGISGGALDEKVPFLRELVAAEDEATRQSPDSHKRVITLPGGRKPHIYVDDWDEEQALKAFDSGFPLALHPHMYKSVQTAREAEALLEKHPKLRFLPDVAHLTVAGEDVVAVLDRNFDRLEAVHLKDWNAEFGRAYQFYARGFTELGRGDVELDKVIGLLKKREYSGWLIVDQDYTPCPRESAIESLRWLRARYSSSGAHDDGKRHPGEARGPEPAVGADGARPVHDPSKHPVRIEVTELPFGFETCSRAELYGEFLDRIIEETSCIFADAWSLDPVGHRLVLVTIRGKVSAADLGTTVLDCATHLSGIAVSRKRTTPFEDVSRPHPSGRTFAHPHLLAIHGIRSMISVPIFNTWSATQVLGVLDFFPAPGTPFLSDQRLEELVKPLARQIEAHLYEECSRRANRLTIMLGKARGIAINSVCQRVGRFVAAAVNSDQTMVYLERPGQQIKRCAETGTIEGHESLAQVIESLTTKSWKSNRTSIILDLRNETGSGVEEPLPADVSLPGLFVPLRDSSGRSKGVIACANLCPNACRGNLRPFNYDHVAIIEAIGQAFVPQLETLLADQHRKASMTKLAHEMRVPVVALKAVAERLQHEAKAKGYSFQFDHFQEMALYHDTLVRLLRELDAVRLGTSRVMLRPRPTYLLTDIVAPAKRFVEPLLRKKGFKAGQLVYRDIEKLPSLYVDPVWMTLVVFNLMDNAIKYYRGDAGEFQLEIEGNDTEQGYELVFRDKGIGVPEGMENYIFQEGTRGSNAFEYDVAGDGLGLWLSRAIVQRHGGGLFVRSNRDPTEFVLVLPHKRASTRLQR